MSQGQKWIRSGLLAGAVALAGMPVASFAQDAAVDQEIQAINNGNVSLTLGADITNEYWFRGISQGAGNTGRLVIQPYADVAFDLYSFPVGDEEITIGFYVGIWNSFTTSGGNFGSTGNWYEADLYAGFSFGLPMGFSADVAYIALENPQGGGEFAQEIDLSLAYDDSALWEQAGIDFMEFGGLQPYILFAFETAGSSDGSGQEGIYFEFGFEPSIVILQSEDYPVTLSVPFALGLSVNDYYVIGGGDDTFGFASVGFALGVPLSFVPAEFGEWEAGVGLTFLFLGDQTRAISVANGTGNQDVRYIVTAGVSMTY